MKLRFVRVELPLLLSTMLSVLALLAATAVGEKLLEIACTDVNVTCAVSMTVRLLAVAV